MIPITKTSWPGVCVCVCPRLQVTGSHGHHGQLPAAEYLVATAAHTFDPVTGAPAFLPWLPFLELCAELGLPTNDTWVVAGGPLAGAARQALDSLAMRGGPTGHALRSLDALVAEGEGQGEAAGCLRLPGTYPHDEWQGERLEGFVVAAGQELGQQVGGGSPGGIGRDSGRELGGGGG